MNDVPNPFSRAFREYIAGLRADLDQMSALLQSIPLSGGNDYARLPFRITGHGSTSSSYPIWTYSGKQQKAASHTGTDGDWVDADDAIVLTNTMVNDLEAGNSSTNGGGYTVAYDSGTWYFDYTGFTAIPFNPVATGVVVWARPMLRPDGTMRWHFSAPNVAPPACEEA